MAETRLVSGWPSRERFSPLTPGLPLHKTPVGLVSFGPGQNFFGLRFSCAGSLLMFHPQGPSFWELARQALSSTERGYDLLAPKFDRTPFRTPEDLLAQVATLIAAEGPTRSALDVCCGTGAGMEMLRPLCKERVVGVDISQGMIEVGRQKVAQAPGSATIEFLRVDALDLPFQKEFDVAVCFGAIGHILPADQPKFIEQIHQSLLPGGRLVLLTAHAPPWNSWRYWLSRSFNAAMHLRNWFVSPPFIMYYLTFLLPAAADLLTGQGFSVTILDDVLQEPWQDLCLLVARKES